MDPDAKNYWTPSLDDVKTPGPVREALESLFESEMAGASSLDVERIVDRTEGVFNHPSLGWVDIDWGTSLAAPHYKAIVTMIRRVWRETNG